MKRLATLLIVLLVACVVSGFTPKEFATRLQQQGPEQALKQISPSEWQTVIAGVSKGDNAWLALVPQFAESIRSLKDRQKRRELIIALAFALVNKPEQTLTMMQPIDRRIAAMTGKGKEGNAPLVDFGSMTACAMPLLLDYDKASNLRYYHTLSMRLKKLGKLGEECLNMLNASMEELLADEARGTPTWEGTKSWYP